jgi:peptidoglycan/LPS O-acetylase OafA/YrhL
VSPGGVRRPNLPALTGLRFVAALYVVLYHYARFWLAGGPSWVEGFNLAGPVAVSLFFILSGLVLTYGSTDAHGRCTKRPKDFWFARFSRIYPLFVVAIIPAIPANVAILHHTHGAAASVGFALGQAVFAMLLLQAWVPHLAFGANAPGWSLSVEAFFYLTFPYLVHRLRCRNLRQLLSLTIPLWVLSMTPALIVEIAERHGHLHGTSTTSVLGTALTPALLAERLAAQFPLARLAEFCIGICIGHFVVARVEQRSGKPTDDLAASNAVQRRLGVMGFASILALAMALGVAGNLRETSEIVVNSGFAAPLFAVLLVSLTLGSGPHVTALSSRTFVRLGTASYALYIIQDPFAWWWQKVVRLDLAQPSWLVLFLAAIVATSVACERWIEIPARAALLRRATFARRTPLAAAHPLGANR